MENWEAISAFLVAMGSLGVIAYGFGRAIYHFSAKQRRLLRSAGEKIRSEEVLRIAHEHELLTPSSLSRATRLSKAEAEAVLMDMMQKGHLSFSYNLGKFQSEFWPRAAFSSAALPVKEREPLDDANALRHAVEAGGELTAAALCLRSGATLEEAEEKLRDMQAKGAFEVDADAEGQLLYRLADRRLLNGDSGGEKLPEG